MITFDPKAGKLGQFTMDSMDVFPVFAELLGKGVRGYENFPVFGDFLRQMQAATAKAAERG